MRVIFPRLVVLLSLFALLLLVACGPAATPTPTKAPVATPTVQLIPTLNVPTPGATAQATAAGPTPTLPPGEQPKYGGTMNRMESSNDVWDPFAPRAGYGLTLNMVGNLYSQLLRVSPKDRSTVEGDLAESWSVSADGASYVFKIRQGVTDGEGNPLTVQDVFYNMMRYIERPNGVNYVRQGCMNYYVKRIYDQDVRKLQYSDSWKPVAGAGAEITGPNEITIRLKGPRAGFIPCLTGGFTTINPMKYQKLIDQDPAGYRDFNVDKKELIGYGPFMVKDVAIGNYAYLVKNPKFFRSGLPYMDGFNIYVVADAATQVAQFRTGKVDMYCTWVCISKADADAIKKDMGDTVVIPNLVAVGYWSYQMNVRRPPWGPVDDLKAKDLRWAIHLALDRQELNAVAFEGIGFLSVPYFIGWDWIYTEKEWRAKPGFNQDTKAKDIADAKALMVKHGYGQNNRLKSSVDCPTTGQGLRQCESMVNQLANIYMDLELKKWDGATVFDRGVKGEFDIRSQSLGAVYPDPDSYNTNVFFTYENGGTQFTSWANPKFMQLFDQQVVALDNKTRGPILRQMADLIIDDAHLIGTIRPPVLQPYRSYMKGWKPPVFDGSNFSFEYTWLNK